MGQEASIPSVAAAGVAISVSTAASSKILESDDGSTNQQRYLSSSNKTDGEMEGEPDHHDQTSDPGSGEMPSVHDTAHLAIAKQSNTLPGKTASDKSGSFSIWSLFGGGGRSSSSGKCMWTSTPATPEESLLVRRRSESAASRCVAKAVASLTSVVCPSGTDGKSSHDKRDDMTDDEGSDESDDEDGLIMSATELAEVLNYWCRIPRRVRSVVCREHGPGNIERLFKKGCKLGSGHIGTVWKVECRETGRVYAMKALPRHRVSDKSFVFEVKALIQLETCPGLIHYEGAYCDNDNFYVLTELARFDLFTAMHSVFGGRMPELEVKCAVKQVCLTLAWLHKRGIVHRDVKPDNIVAISSRVYKVIDVEHMMVVNNDSVLDDLCGTARFMSPARFRRYTGYEAKAADVWALGVCVFELLTGYRCFEGENTAQIEWNVKNARWSWPSCDVSVSARDFVQRCLTLDVRKRFTASEALMHHWLA